jgi:nucleoid DNA-binding protein
MTKADIIDVISHATGMTKVDTGAAVNGFISAVSEALQRGERVDLRSFGSFNVKVRKPKKARNPGTNAVIELPERLVPAFKPSRILKNAVNLEYKHRKSQSIW